MRVISVRIDERDIQDGMDIAAKKRMRFQAWLRSVIHQAIEAEKQDCGVTNEMDVTTNKSFGQVILAAGKKKNWDIYTTPFRPSDLGLNAPQYGSFSDHSVNGTTLSSRYSRSQYLIPVREDALRRPEAYLAVNNYIHIFSDKDELVVRYPELHHLGPAPWYSFEILGFEGDIDLVLICCYGFKSEQEAKKTADELLQTGGKEFPAIDTNVVWLLEDVSVGTKSKIEAVAKKDSDTGEMTLSYYIFNPGRVAVAEHSTPRINNALVDVNFNEVLLRAKQRLGRKG